MNIYSPARRNDAAATGGPQAQSQDIKYRADAAGYVAAMLAELRQIAGRAGFDRLVKSLDAAYYDAYVALDARGRAAAAAPAAKAAGNTTEKISPGVEPGHP